MSEGPDAGLEEGVARFPAVPTEGVAAAECRSEALAVRVDSPFRTESSKKVEAGGAGDELHVESIAPLGSCGAGGGEVNG